MANKITINGFIFILLNNFYIDSSTIIYSGESSESDCDSIDIEDLRKSCLNSQLLEAVKNDDLIKVNELINKGTDVNIIYDGKTPISVAKSEQMVNLLIENGADIDQIIEDMEKIQMQGIAGHALDDSDGATALILAILDEDLNKIKILLEAGADLNEKNYKNRTAFDVSKNSSRSTRIIKMLKDESKKRIKKRKESLKKIISINLPKSLADLITDYIEEDITKIERIYQQKAKKTDNGKSEENKDN